MRTIWKERLRILVHVYTHSTVSELTDEALQFSTLIQDNQNSTAELPTLIISLIWKNVSDTELICTTVSSLSCNYSINGEMNILRYLMRIGPNEFSHEMSNESNNIDVILDICHQLISVKNNNMTKEKQAILKNLSGKLGKNQYFIGNSITVCDIAVCSAIKQCTSEKELQQSLTKWFKNVNEIIGY